MAVKRFADAMSHITKQHPDAKAKDIERWGWTHLDVAVAEESIRKALHGRIDPTACAVELLMVLSSYFGVEPSALGPDAERRLTAVLTYAGMGGPEDDGTPSDLPGQSSPCMTDNVVPLRGVEWGGRQAVAA